MGSGLCPLCRATKEIADSHLIPKAVYPYCRDPQGNTIVINPDFLGFSDRQIHTPLPSSAPIGSPFALSLSGSRLSRPIWL
jgi:hypothetical protein